MGKGIDDSMKIKKIVTSSYKCIVFDKMLLYNPKQLYSLQSYMEQNNEKQFYSIGDIDQRKLFKIINSMKSVNTTSRLFLLC